ncbi:dTMP kinase [Leucobacter sp. OH2974_COT-288]|nr:dTMP kinase [Leucobacter sp. OH2974_COT-288]
MTQGFFIVFEGGDGAGKTTQALMLEQALEKHGREVVQTREPGGTKLGQEIRQLLLHGEAVDPRAEALLYAADRAHHVATLVRPALHRGAVVIQDRYIDSSAAYQGAARELGEPEIRKLSEWGTGQLQPDLTIVLDIDPVVGAARRDKRGLQADRLEAESLEFHRVVREAFLHYAEVAPHRYLVLDATMDMVDLHAQITARLGAMGLL